MEEASALASVLPAPLCKQKLHQSTSEWFTYEALDLCEGITFEPNSNKFSSQEDQLFDDLLEEDFGKCIRHHSIRRNTGRPSLTQQIHNPTRRRQFYLLRDDDGRQKTPSIHPHDGH